MGENSFFGGEKTQKIYNIVSENKPENKLDFPNLYHKFLNQRI